MHAYGQEHLKNLFSLQYKTNIYGENFEGFEHTLKIICLHKYFQIFHFYANCGVSKGSALQLRLTGSVVQPKSCYDLLTYKAIGSNYLSFVVTSMLVFHIATG